MSSKRKQLVAVPANVTQICLVCSLYQRLQYLALQSPIEICGGLYGLVHEQKLIITHSRTCRNLDASQNSFSLDINELFILPEGLLTNAGLIGIYHSHVNQPPNLSDVDCYFLSLAPLVWLIMGQSIETGDFELRCFARINALIEEIPYVLINEFVGV